MTARETGVLVCLLSIVFALAFSGCATTERDWQEANRLGTVKTYELFLQKHPQSKHTEQANAALDDLRFEQAKESDSIVAYESYLKHNPPGSGAEDAQSRLRELREDNLWKKVRTAGDLYALDTYISAYPDGRYATQARKLQAKLTEELQEKQAWDAVKSSGDIAAIDNFLKTYSDSGFADQARQLRLNLAQAEDDKAFEKANEQGNAEALQAYLESYPRGRHMIQAKRELTLAARLEEIRLDRPALEDFIKKHDSGHWYWAGREAIEDLIIAEILEKGVGERFLIADLLPDPESPTGSITVAATSNSSLVRLKTLYPRDKLEFGLTTSGLKPVRPLGNKSIWRFMGKVEFMGYTFDGAENEPLSFMFLDSAGFVYLAGKGSVGLKDRTVELPLHPHGTCPVRS